MTDQQVPTSADVGSMYDNSTDLLSEVMGGNIHLGYWRDENDDSSVEAATDALTDMVADRLALRSGLRVLDIGCGSGKPATYIAIERDVHVTGVTISAHQAAVANRRPQVGDGNRQVTFRQADAMELPYPDEHFDRAYAIESFLHMSDRGKAIAEAARVLRPGGVLVTANPYQQGELDARGTEIVAANRKLFQIPPIGDADEYVEHMVKAGLEIVELVDIGENVRRSHTLAAALIRENNGSFDGSFNEELAEAADIIERFGDLPQIGYGLIAARKP
ncbi:methyltransferase domain-containing protein [Streptomyces sp. SP18CS02]|uniref:methyltransferase domain-containing protein n=1 Tax=Streptomyces sp. SP18CS02 TaxID=3002531 RepID=UPI002E7A949B|nr:methyltransferase domain-containing protein [Streptomyces sp. SP18CS02]MEE1757445.1 methyltransferase domain-containing protein [Streptomyces sp. SP18CS02]